MTADHYFRDDPGFVPAEKPEDRPFLFLFQPIDRVGREDILTACDSTDAIGHIAEEDSLTIWVRAREAAELLRKLGGGRLPVRISLVSTTTLNPSEVADIRAVVGDGTTLDFGLLFDESSDGSSAK